METQLSQADNGSVERLFQLGGGGEVYLCRGHDGDSSDDLGPVGDLLFGSNNIWQSFLVLRVLLPIRRLWHLKRNATFLAKHKG